MRPDLLRWQRELYDGNHTTRRNLLIHILTVPLFWQGTLFLLAGWLVTWWVPLVGLGLMAFAVVLQGRGHAGEKVPPVPFEGAGDVLSRIFVEQWITFPRYLFSGGFASAWRQSR